MRILLLIISLTLSFSIFATTIPVGKDYPVKSIRAAIKVAKDGDTVFIHAGVYREGNIIITKSLYIEGAGDATLDGEGKFEILTLSGKNITVRKLHFANAGYSSMNDFAAIKVIDAWHIKIEENVIQNTAFAIHIANSTHCIILNNRITGTNLSEHSSGNGVHLWKCENMLISGNTIMGHRDGIYLEFVSHSTIALNLSEKNVRYGLHFMFSHENSYLGNTFLDNGAGVAVMYSKKVRMLGNHFRHNWGPSAYGILLKDITDSHILLNKFESNTTAIHMEGSSRIVIEKNTFRENGWAIRVQASCDNNTFSRNNFLGNSFDLATNGTMVLNYFSNNYWDKYEGYDMNHDGVGDVPHHPVSMYSMIVEQNPHALMLMRSFTVTLLDKAEKAIPGLTPDELADHSPMMKQLKL